MVPQLSIKYVQYENNISQVLQTKMHAGKKLISNISTSMSVYIKKNSDCQYVSNIYTTASSLFNVAT